MPEPPSKAPRKPPPPGPWLALRLVQAAHEPAPLHRICLAHLMAISPPAKRFALAIRSAIAPATARRETLRLYQVPESAAPAADASIQDDAHTWRSHAATLLQLAIQAHNIETEPRLRPRERHLRRLANLALFLEAGATPPPTDRIDYALAHLAQDLLHPNPPEDRIKSPSAFCKTHFGLESQQIADLDRKPPSASLPAPLKIASRITTIPGVMPHVIRYRQPNTGSAPRAV